MKVKVAGVWKDAQPHVKVAGSWKAVQKGYVRVAGTWREFYQSRRALAEWIAWCDAQTSIEGVTLIKNVAPTRNTGPLVDWATLGLHMSGTFADTGTMYGSPWGDRSMYPSQYHRIVQHSMPDQATWTQLKAQGNTRILIAERFEGEFPSATGQTRNGYTSLSYADGQNWACHRNEWLYYFDDRVGKAYRINPSAATAPVEFTDW